MSSRDLDLIDPRACASPYAVGCKFHHRFKEGGWQQSWWRQQGVRRLRLSWRIVWRRSLLTQKWRSWYLPVYDCCYDVCGELLLHQQDRLPHRQLHPHDHLLHDCLHFHVLHPRAHHDASQAPAPMYWRCMLRKRETLFSLLRIVHNRLPYNQSRLVFGCRLRPQFRWREAEESSTDQKTLM